MSPETWFLRLAAMPDPAYPPSRLKAGGDVRAGAWADSLHVLRALAVFEPGTSQGAISLLVPPPPGTNRQERLSVYLGGRAEPWRGHGSRPPVAARAVPQRFYGSKRRGAAIEWGRFGAACDVVRRQVLLQPTGRRGVQPQGAARVLP
jgi:hypothetical protein